MEGIEDYINQQKELINKAIESCLEQTFSSKLRFCHCEAAVYTIYPEGHRYRSLIGLEIYQMLGGDQSKFLKSAVGIEAVHHASLILDDLPCMDNSPIRKGKPTAHKAFGEDIAILASIYLWDIGRELLYKNAQEHLSNLNKLSSVQLLIDSTIRKVISGQELDLRKNKDKKELWKSIEKKNGFFYLASVLPAYLCDIQKEMGIFDEIGVDLSVAYQLFDDLRDLEGKPEVVGKLTHIDSDTSVYIFGADKVKQHLTKRKERIIENIRKIQSNSRLEKLVGYILTKQT